MNLMKTGSENVEDSSFTENSSDEEELQNKKKVKNNEFDPDFKLWNSIEDYNRDILSEMYENRKKNNINKLTKSDQRPMKSNLDDKISKARDKLKKEKFNGGNHDVNDKISTSDEEDDIKEIDSDDNIYLSEDLQKEKIKLKEKEFPKKKKKKIKTLGLEQIPADFKADYFFEDLQYYNENISFFELNLHRLLMKAIDKMGYVHPTPIQAATIPVALQGRDICGCAATGTGKTAAYMLPVLQRVINKSSIRATRVIILVPTRELGVQVYEVAKQLAQFCKHIEIALAVGGLNVKLQEAALRKSPDIIIATPGRMIDHLRNTPSFDLRTIEAIILDEADRMLDVYFLEQMTEIIKQCSRTKQTILFSATMTDAVTDLAALSLKNPVRIFVDGNREVALNLRQEFIKLSKENSSDREAILAALVCRLYHDHTLIFVQTKNEAHRIHILLGLLDIKVAELHGNMTQPQRLEALQKFRDEEVDVLVATDVAARGLDISGVKTVINFILPATFEHYIHRVGRTARAGRTGVSVSLCGKTTAERTIVKDIVKGAHHPVKSREIPQETLETYRKKVSDLEENIAEILQEENEEKAIQQAEVQMNKIKNKLESKKLERERKRTWFQTKKERKVIKERLKISDQEKKIGKNKDVYFDDGTPEKKIQKNKNFLGTENPKDRIDREMRQIALLQARLYKTNKLKKNKEAASNNSNIRESKRKLHMSFAKDLTDISAVKRLRYDANKQKKEESRAKEKTGKKMLKKRR